MSGEVCAEAGRAAHVIAVPSQRPLDPDRHRRPGFAIVRRMCDLYTHPSHFRKMSGGREVQQFYTFAEEQPGPLAFPKVVEAEMIL